MVGDMSETGNILEISEVSKSFPGVKALDNVSMSFRAAEVHVLLGENGAGKSTLMKILAGIYDKDRGEIIFEGRPVSCRNVREAQKLGINIIHQELNLLPNRTIAQNIFLGREPLKASPLRVIDTRKMYQASEDLLARIGLQVKPDTMVKDLSIAQQQMVEVAKALSVDTKVLIMDEPTSSLTKKEIDRLFEIIRQLRDQGMSIIYISHRMEEIFRIGDRVSVLRDGKFIGTLPVGETTMDQLVFMMVGRTITNMYQRHRIAPGRVLLETDGLTGLRFRHASIKVHEGEIVGLAGLVGAGRSELARSVFGYDPILGGAVMVDGHRIDKPSPMNSVGHGIAFLPEDRKTEGLILSAPIMSNIVQASLPRLFKNHLLNRKIEMRTAEEYRKKLNIASPDVTRLVNFLSGGNQQKVVLGKWLCTGSHVFIFDEPTRGIDVGAKSEIYELMDKLAHAGNGIIVISSDLTELFGITDRIYVMCDGEIAAEFKNENITPEQVLSYAIGRN